MMTVWWIVGAFTMGGSAGVFLTALLLMAFDGRRATDQVVGL